MLIPKMQEGTGEQQQATERNPLSADEKKRDHGKEAKAHGNENHGRLRQAVAVQDHGARTDNVTGHHNRGALALQRDLQEHGRQQTQRGKADDNHDCRFVRCERNQRTGIPGQRQRGGGEGKLRLPHSMRSPVPDQENENEAKQQ